MRSFGGMVVALGLAMLPGVAGAQAICKEAARAVQLPASFGLEADARDLVAEVQARAGVSLPPPVYADWTVLPWREVLADHAAKLPPALADLPMLTLLADIETVNGSGTAIMMALGTTGAVIADLPPVLRRHGLDSRADSFETAVQSFPAWSEGLEKRQAYLAQAGASNWGESPLYQALYGYPQDGAVRRTAYLMGLKDPATRARWLDRAGAASPDERLGWLLARLSRDCGWSAWWGAEGAAQVMAGQGRVQGQLMLLSDYIQNASYGTPLDYLYTTQGNNAPELAAVLEERGMTAEAELLRDGMDLFGVPWPREEEARSLVMLDERKDLPAALTSQSPPELTEKLRAEMLKIATEAGLLPR